MPKIMVTLEYESEKALKKAAEIEGGQFVSVEDYLSRELGWLIESGFSTVGITEEKEFTGTKVKKVCARCGSEDVKFDAFAVWNFEEQRLEVCMVSDKGDVCEDCDGECRIIDVEVER